MKRSKKGFTLAELLVVIAIIAILVAIAIPTFSAAKQKAVNAVAEADARAAYAEYTVAVLDEQEDVPTTYKYQSSYGTVQCDLTVDADAGTVEIEVTMPENTLQPDNDPYIFGRG